jgi:hypothetical protein
VAKPQEKDGEKRLNNQTGRENNIKKGTIHSTSLTPLLNALRLP